MVCLRKGNLFVDPMSFQQFNFFAAHFVVENLPPFESVSTRRQRLNMQRNIFVNDAPNLVIVVHHGKASNGKLPFYERLSMKTS